MGSRGPPPMAPRRGSVELPQVHPGVERRHLIAVAVERKRLPPPELADPALGGLAPAWMVHGGVHVGVEAVLLRRRLLPRGLGLLAHEADPHERLDALEPVLPRDHDPDRRA